MSRNIAQYEQFVNALDKVMEDPEIFRDKMVQSSIDRIKCNLTSKSVHTLRPFVVKMASSPEMLCTMTNQELWVLEEAVADELKFRQNQGVA